MKELKVQPIRNGTVIDHITAGQAVNVLRILHLPRRGWTSTITAAMNVPSADGRKDIVKIEDRELDSDEVNRIALIAPSATINIVREYELVSKTRVELPDKVQGIVRCPNNACVTNHQPIQTAFTIQTKQPLHLRCAYCDRDVDDVAAAVA